MPYIINRISSEVIGSYRCDANKQVLALWKIGSLVWLYNLPYLPNVFNQADPCKQGTSMIQIRYFRMPHLISFFSVCHSSNSFYMWASAWPNLQIGMCAQRRLISAWASAQSVQIYAWRKLGSLATHRAHREDWSDWAEAQTDQSALGKHPFCWFCCALVHIVFVINSKWNRHVQILRQIL